MAEIWYSITIKGKEIRTMKNKFDTNNIPTIRQECNEWCCPCNEGKGCQANENCACACDNAFFNETDMWNVLMTKAYETMNTTEYDAVCKEMYNFANNEKRD